MPYTLPEELQSVVEAWTQEQYRQASAAVFNDSDLSFTVKRVAEASVQNGRAAELDAAVTAGIETRRLPQVTIEDLKYVGGLDISFREDGKGKEGIAVLAVLSFPELKLVTHVSRVVSLASTPYVPSFLSFREAAPLASVLDDLRASGGPAPQLLFVDGNGRFHVRHAGSAVAVGLLCGLPTIGVAKEYHPLPCHVGEHTGSKADFRSSQKGFRRAIKGFLRQRGDWLPLSDEHGEIVGGALLSSPAKRSSNPVFVSSGHRVSLDTCLQLTRACCSEARVPEPIRSADAIGRRLVAEKWPDDASEG